MTQPWDIFIVGGGPAGAGSAAFLAAAGFRVVLGESKTFPREKVCGEFMGTKLRPILARLGLLDDYDQLAGPGIRYVAACPPGGGSADILTGPMTSDDLGHFPRALGRAQLDDMLLNRARQLGAHIEQPSHVHSIAGNAASGFTITTSTGQFRARAVILAHGLAQRGDLDQTHPPRPLRRQYVSFKTHFSDCRLDHETIAIGGAAGLYAGLVKTSHDRFSLAFVVRREQVLRLGPDPDAHLAALCRQNPGFKQMLQPVRHTSPWLASGPLEPGIRCLYHDGRYFVGNAAGEVHALIGEGITLALRAAEILAGTLQHTSLDNLAEAGRLYEHLWRKEFAWRYTAAHLLANTMMRPTLAALSATLLHAYPELFAACIRHSGK